MSKLDEWIIIITNRPSVKKMGFSRMISIYIITSIAVIASLIADRGKTARAFRVAAKKMTRAGVPFMAVSLPPERPAGRRDREAASRPSVSR